MDVKCKHLIAGTWTLDSNPLRPSVQFANYIGMERGF
jgi:hypothetical protein